MGSASSTISPSITEAMGEGVTITNEATPSVTSAAPQAGCSHSNLQPSNSCEPSASLCGAHPEDRRPQAEPDDVILVTGFGPFGQHLVNASWEAVSRLHDIAPHRRYGARLVIEEVPVQYDYVSREMPRRWRQLRPRLVVHVGVSSETMTLKLERRAHNGPYQQCDAQQRTPPHGCCLPGYADEIATGLDLEIARRAVAESGLPVEASISEDPGRYLCDFIYYTSLSEDPARTVFVHVPPLGMPYNARQIAEALSVLIEELYRQVLSKDGRQKGQKAAGVCGEPAQKAVQTS